MTKQSSIRTLSAGSIGNFGEIYDFAVFGFSVPILSAHFFPGSDRTAALLSTFAVYAVAFFARPLGGLLFGVMADKVGRVKVMAMTVWLMALGTAVIGLLPTYASIGIAAPALLVFCRIAQGLALGGETTGTTSFILESAPDDRRGGWIGLTLIFSHLPNALVAGLLIGLQFAAGASAYADWVWRVPFLAGGLIGIVGFWLRRNLDEPDEYKQATSRSDLKNFVLRTGFSSSGSSESPDNDSLNSRIPLPTERPTSGSFFGPRTIRAITSTTTSSGVRCWAWLKGTPSRGATRRSPWTIGGRRYHHTVESRFSTSSTGSV